MSDKNAMRPFVLFTALAVLLAGCVTSPHQPPATDSVLIIRDVKHLPMESWTPLTNDLHQGRRVLFIGCDPFEARVRLTAAGPETEAQLFEKLAREAPRVPVLSDFSQWQHENQSGNLGNTSPDVTVTDFREWDALVLTNAPPLTGNSVVLQARGDTNTCQLAIVAAEADGAHWHCVVPLTTEWQSFVLHETKFQFSYGGSNRGRPEDRLSLARVRRFAVGLYRQLGTPTPGRYAFSVSDVRIATDPRSVSEIAGWPDILLVSPPYRHYTIKPGIQSPLARARGPGAPYRWIPLREERDNHGRVLGWPVSMYADASNRWAWIAMDNPPAALIAKTVRALQDELPPAPKPLPPAPVDRDEWVTVNGSHLVHRGRPVFLNGINYWPLSHNGKAPGEFGPHWLEPAWFDLEIIRRDLDRLRDLGINAVSIQYHEESQAPQLRWFVHECRRRGIWVLPYLGYVHPFQQDFAKAQRLIESADLAHLPGVFALDIGWEPYLGLHDQRRRFDRDWENWLVEQSVVGPWSAPSDEELKTDGPHHAAVTLYRRFVDDCMSRRYGEVVRFIRRLGCRQLITVRSGYGGNGNHWADPFLPIDLASGAVHLDFISPEGYALTGDLDQFFEGGFITAYARGMSGGKPVVWLEFGCSVGQSPQPTDLANQARLYRNMFELAKRSHAAGVFGWWYPGGWRVDEKSDFGIVNPDSTPRPAAWEFKKLVGAPLGAGRPAPWTGRTVNPHAHATGLSGLWDDWRATYRQELRENRMQELRPTAYANAEWGRIEINGREFPRRPGEKLIVKPGDQLRLELINTGSTEWANVLVADRPVDSIDYGQSAWISWTANDSIKLRPMVKGFGAFGEPLEIELTAD